MWIPTRFRLSENLNKAYSTASKSDSHKCRSHSSHHGPFEVNQIWIGTAYTTHILVQPKPTPARGGQIVNARMILPCWLERQVGTCNNILIVRSLERDGNHGVNQPESREQSSVDTLQSVIRMKINSINRETREERETATLLDRETNSYLIREKRVFRTKTGPL